MNAEGSGDMSVSRAAEGELIARRRQLRAAWRQVLKSGATPDYEALVESALEAERESLRRELDQLARTYGTSPNNGAGPAATVDVPPPGAETAEIPAGPTGATAAVEATQDLPPAGDGATTDFVVSAPPPGEVTASFVPGRAAVPPEEVPAAAPSLAGYEILGVLGRGGMGVVYKARQPGLKRVVALKMIRAGDGAGEHELGRFRTEAEAAARLQHPNIVQVYAVGEHDGCPFLSLEYVDGGSLKDKLGGKPQPVEAAAQLVQVLAEAMEFAHHRHIIHRDLKPANIMLARPEGPGDTHSLSNKAPLVEELYGTPKIADFGLAKRLEEDTGQTHSGTILGTPSYMPPEQAMGQAKGVGPLADQYALGAILYELLTGRPPFQGATLLETLDQVRTQEPVPPSRLQPKVPRDLETTCLKCLQKEPAKRYANALELADDLRRFVAGEPIKARPVSVWERLRRWCWRNPWLAGLAGVALLLLLGMVIVWAVFTVRLSKEKAATTEANVQLGKANVQLGAEKKAAEEARDLAQDQRKLALQSLGSLVTTVQSKLKTRPDLQPLRRELLDIALEKLKQASPKTEARISLNDGVLAARQFELGLLLWEEGETAKAGEAFGQAEAIYAAQARADPEDPMPRAMQAQVLMWLGRVALRQNGRAADARAYYARADALLADIEKGPPHEKPSPADVKNLRADALVTLGANTVNEDPRAALDYYRAALRLRQELADLDNSEGARAQLARMYVLVGGLEFGQGNVKAAEELGTRAVEIRRQLADATPDDAQRQRDLAGARLRLGGLYLRTGRPEQAAREYRPAADALDQVAKEDPKNVHLQEDLARARYDEGTAALRWGDGPRAAEKFAASLKIREALAGKSQDVSVQKELMLSLARCGEDRRAADIARRLREKYGDDAGQLYDVACCYAICAGPATANAKARTQYRDLALDVLEQAVERGYRDAGNMETDPDLDAVRDEPRVKELLKKLRAPAPK
jgi:serine/threonine-protein kinase